MWSPSVGLSAQSFVILIPARGKIEGDPFKLLLNCILTKGDRVQPSVPISGDKGGSLSSPDKGSLLVVS